MNLPSHLTSTFRWWKRILSDPRQYKTISVKVAVCEIFTDASLSGWGASCGELRTLGWWSEEEKAEHINYLELKAVFYAMRCFAADLRNSYILLRVDNTTAIAYVNRFGSIQYLRLHSLAKQIWGWCEERNNFVFAFYIATIDNSVADLESRRISVDTEWCLSSKAFIQLSLKLDSPEIDLFVSILNAKCSAYVSWIPDPGSVTVDAFSVSWVDIFFLRFSTLYPPSSGSP